MALADTVTCMSSDSAPVSILPDDLRPECIVAELLRAGITPATIERATRVPLAVWEQCNSLGTANSPAHEVGSAAPRQPSLCRYAQLYELRDIVLSLQYSGLGAFVDEWLGTPQPHLAGWKPVDLLAQGDSLLVHEVLPG